MKVTILLCVILFVLFPLGRSADVYKAIATLFDASSTGAITGTITFTADPVNPTAGTTVHVQVTGIPSDGPHGIHIHEFGDLRGFLASVQSGSSSVKGAGSVGLHFNPNGSSHGCPPNAPYHLGDLGNWNVTAGVINESRLYTDVLLTSNNSVVGRAVVLHNTTDDCMATLSSGTRLAVGVIGITNPVNDTNLAKTSAAVTQAVCVFQGSGFCVNNCVLGQGGYIVLTASDASSPNITINGQFFGLQAQYGLHLHWYGDLTTLDDGLSAGGHYNPQSNTHGLPTVNDDRHLGDLGNIIGFDANDGFYKYAPTYPDVTGWTIADLMGRAFILHADVDHGRAPDCPQGTVTGNAGNRLLLCVIGAVNSDPTLPAPSPDGITFSNKWNQLSCASPPPPINPQPTPTPTPTPTNGASIITFGFGLLNLLFVLSVLI